MEELNELEKQIVGAYVEKFLLEINKKLTDFYLLPGTSKIIIKYLIDSPNENGHIVLNPGLEKELKIELYKELKNIAIKEFLNQPRKTAS